MNTHFRGYNDDARGMRMTTFLSGLLIGGLAGAVAMLFMAPQSGRDTRLQIRNKGMLIRDRVAETADEARQRAGEMAGQARERATEMAAQARERAGEVAGQAREKAQQLTDEARARLERA